MFHVAFLGNWWIHYSGLWQELWNHDASWQERVKPCCQCSSYCSCKGNATPSVTFRNSPAVYFCVPAVSAVGLLGILVFVWHQPTFPSFQFALQLMSSFDLEKVEGEWSGFCFNLFVIVLGSIHFPFFFFGVPLWEIGHLSSSSEWMIPCAMILVKCPSP